MTGHPKLNGNNQVPQGKIISAEVKDELFEGSPLVLLSWLRSDGRKEIIKTNLERIYALTKFHKLFEDSLETPTNRRFLKDGT